VQAIHADSGRGFDAHGYRRCSRLKLRCQSRSSLA
jgi:hypothetical protein